MNPDGNNGISGEDLNGDGDGELNEESIAGGIHDWVLQTLSEDAEDANADSDGIGRSGDPIEASAIPGLHDMVLDALAEVDSPSPSFGAKASSQLAYDNLQTLLLRSKRIRAIATDVDGTLLAGRYLHPITQDAVLKAIDEASHSSNDADGASATPSSEPARKIRHFFVATGKSRRGAVESLGPVIGPLLYKLPGVYIQGLYCVDAAGNVVFEKKLSCGAVRAAEELVAEFGLSIVGYDGDDLYTTKQTEVVISLSEVYGEPIVQLIDDKDAHSLAEHAPGMHKLLLMSENVEDLALFRPRLEKLAKINGATVTQAIPTMLELLPVGCSKAHGVAQLCSALCIDVAEELLALGDAENDAGLLEAAAVGVAVGNACPRAREAADFIMRERHDEGAAGLAMNLFGFDGGDGEVR